MEGLDAEVKALRKENSKMAKQHGDDTQKIRDLKQKHALALVSQHHAFESS